ncbi:MAG: hypothetical protein LUQ36_09455 [Methanoregula sp.]|nr:hypothetical protein [Methanoregula sp.]
MSLADLSTAVNPADAGRTGAEGSFARLPVSLLSCQNYAGLPVTAAILNRRCLNPG